ncbi:MAG: NUDIX hydrolase [Planctomycetota bacterium]
MNAREELRAMLAAYVAAHPDESETAARIGRLVTGHADCFQRGCRPGHLTASAWVVSADGARHLLLRHRKLGKWLQPGGHADGDTDLLAVARREVTEETGLSGLEPIVSASGLLPLDLDVHQIPARIDANGAEIDDAHEHHDVRFLFRATGEDRLTANHESDGLAWLEPDGVQARTDEESVLRLMRKAMTRLA